MATYDPKVDSSNGTEQYRTKTGFGGVILKWSEGHCPCGCTGKPSGAGRTFRMGHDARHRGQLIRAYIAGVDFMIVGIDGPTKQAVRTPKELAARYGWEPYLDVAKTKDDARVAAKAERASARLLEKAMAESAVQAGDRKLIRVGRWDYTGQVVAIWEHDDVVEFQYVTKSGDTKRATRTRAEAADLPDVS